MKTKDELRAEVEFLDAALIDIDKSTEGRSLDPDEQAKWDEGIAARTASANALVAIEKREQELRDLAKSRPASVVPGSALAVIVRDTPTLNDLRAFASAGEMRDVAMRSIEGIVGATDEQRGGIESTLLACERADGRVSRHIIATSSPEYRSAFAKAITPGGAMTMTHEEARALEVVRAASLTDNVGGYAVPPHLDPTIIYTGNGATNPIRSIARVERGTADVWNGVSSAGVSASYDAEAAEVSDDTPTLAQPSITARMARAFVPFSIEIGMDWPGMQQSLSNEINRAKDVLEATVFVTGASGSNQPIGIVTALAGTASAITEASSETFTLADVYAIDNAIPAEYEDSSTWLAHKAIYNLIRQFDTNGGAGLWTTLGNGRPNELLGSPAVNSSAMDSAFDAGATANNYLLVKGDFSNYVIYDRIGLSVELVPHLFATANNLPSGQRGLFAYWRNGADSVNDNAFRMLNLDTAA